MGRLAHLQLTLPTAVNQPGAEHIVVDYSCPERAGDWVERNFPQVRVVRVPGRKSFNVSAARNAGAAAARASWLFFRDADVAVAPGFAAEVLPLLREGGHYRSRLKAIGPLAGALICAREEYIRVGGYDDAMEGWGYEDVDMYARLRLAGSEARVFPERLLSALNHDDASRVANYDLKHRELSRVVNKLYSLAKLELGAKAGRPLNEASRRALYADVRRILPALLRDRKKKAVRIGAPGGGQVSFTFDPATGEIERTA
jgi:hypothetical protein